MTNHDHQGHSIMSAIFEWQNAAQPDTDMLTVCCPQCESPLTLHQPDEELAERLLATCEDCKSWFLANSDVSVLTPILEASDQLL
jgi:uncharacterized protein YbaR (Trm112 family)